MNPKIKKIDTEYEKNAAKITELQARQRELEKQRMELENLDIIGLVRSMGLTPTSWPRSSRLRRPSRSPRRSGRRTAMRRFKTLFLLLSTIVRAKPDPAPSVPKSHPCYGCKRRMCPALLPGRGADAASVNFSEYSVASVG